MSAAKNVRRAADLLACRIGGCNMDVDTILTETVEDAIDSYLRGFGDPQRLLVLLRNSTVLVPLSTDGALYVSTVRGCDWLAAFTEVDQYSAYLDARDQEVGHNQALSGSAVIDELLPQLGDRVGMVINPAGGSPFAFPADALRASGD